MAYRQILYHIIFRTKYSKKTIPIKYERELYQYIWGIIKNKSGVLFQINGMEEHIHILSDLHPSIALADYIKDIKVGSSKWLKANPNFPNFEGWAKKYCALTYSYNERNIIIQYIKNQKEHHKKEPFRKEMERLFKEQNIEDKGNWFWKEE